VFYTPLPFQKIKISIISKLQITQTSSSSSSVIVGTSKF
jgi:hypothetical protein